MKTRDTKKAERCIAFRNWRRHIGAAKRIQFEESRRKITPRDLNAEVASSSPESSDRDPSR